LVKWLSWHWEVHDFGTFARYYIDKKSLRVSFFFSRGDGDVSRAGKFVTSIALQFASSIPSICQYTCGTITEHHNIANQSLRDQWHLLVLRPLITLNGNSCQSFYVIIIDAFDKCDDDKDIRIIPQLLAEAPRWAVSSKTFSIAVIIYQYLLIF
jgi:hypothetical protein